MYLIWLVNFGSRYILLALFFFLSGKVASESAVCEYGTISSIKIDNNNVFQLHNPEEDKLFYRTANTLHLVSRKNVIRSQLLFIIGDCYSKKIAEETERKLRENRYIQKADVNTLVNGEGDIDVVVRTSDTWSTKIKISYSQRGGETKTQLGLQENNLLGLGVDLGLLLKSDIDRDSTIFKLSDRSLFNTQNQISLAYADSSDGFLKSISLGKPFYALASRSSYGVSFFEEEKERNYYFKGVRYFTYLEKSKHADIFYGWSKGLEAGMSLRHRVGFKAEKILYDRVIEQPMVTDITIKNHINAHMLVPEDIVEYYPYYAIDYTEDAYDTIQNHDQIARVEDRYTGLRIGFSAGYVDADFSDKMEAHWKVSGYINKLFEITEKSTLKANIALEFERHSDDITNILESHSLKFYHRMSDFFTTYLDYVSINGKKIRQGQQLFLDTTAGLRGYPVRYISGESIQKITLEQRYFSDFEMFRMLNFGAAAFFDVGVVSGGAEFAQEQAVFYRSVGIGLRVANNRSSEGTIIHFDLTRALDKEDDNAFQLSVIARKTF